MSGSDYITGMEGAGLVQLNLQDDSDLKRGFLKEEIETDPLALDVDGLDCHMSHTETTVAAPESRRICDYLDEKVLIKTEKNLNCEEEFGRRLQFNHEIVDNLTNFEETEMDVKDIDLGQVQLTATNIKLESTWDEEGALLELAGGGINMPTKQEDYTVLVKREDGDVTSSSQLELLPGSLEGPLKSKMSLMCEDSTEDCLGVEQEILPDSTIGETVKDEEHNSSSFPEELMRKQNLQNHKMAENVKNNKMDQLPFIAECPAEFVSEEVLNNNCLKMNAPKKRYTCVHCSKDFFEKNTLTAHVRRAHYQKIKRFGCTNCTAIFSLKKYLVEHLKIHQFSKEFRCTLCSAEFTLQKELDTHVKLHTQKYFYKCTLCTAKFFRKSDLDTHVRKHFKNWFKCTFCTTEFAQKGELDVHLDKDHSKDGFKCTLCAAKFARMRELVEHKKIKHPKDWFKCTLCLAKFTRRRELDVHMIIDYPKDWFKCTLCLVKLSSKQDLDVHMKMHTGEQKFSCTHCDATFALEWNLSTHVRRLHSETTFGCTQCNAVFATDLVLQRHLGLHFKAEQSKFTGAYTFGCTQCNAVFATDLLLQQHLRLQCKEGQSKYCCKHCDAQLFSQWLLAEHTKTHTVRKTLPCTVCSEVFMYKTTLKRHLKTHKQIKTP